MNLPALHIQTLGKGAPLVMLHGWGWHAGIWVPLVSELASHYQLFLVDLPGCGKSPLLTPAYTFDAIAAQLFSCIPDQAHWLGWSLGGMLAWWVAIHHPEKITKFITVASSPCFVETADWPGVKIETLEKFGSLLIAQPENTLLDFLELQLRGTPNSAVLFSQLKTELMQRNAPHQEALQGGLALLRQTDFRHQLQKINLPSLHLFAQKDRLVPAAIARHIQPLLRQGHCEVIAQTGHIPFLSQPAVFLQWVKQFLSAEYDFGGHGQKAAFAHPTS
jgi:pimeloyl-[acyl-carrier protein] methyl ester esterase